MFHHTPAPINSCWGPVQHATCVAPGIWEVSTASHGGIVVSEQRRQAMPSYLRDCRAYGNTHSFEEDCEWVLVALSFPEAFYAEAVDAAHQILRGMPAICAADRRAAWERAAGRQTVAT